MKYGLSEKQLNEIAAFISPYSEIEEAVLFGSRAMDTYKEASDVDIALKGDRVTASLAAKLKFDIEEDTYLPFFFDFVAYPTITNEALKEHIDTQGIVIYRKGWRECRLGEVVNFGNGKVRPKTEGLIPVYGGNGILDYCSKFNYKDETIVIGRVGAYCGSVYYENRPIWVSDNALAAKAKDGNDPKFLFYFLRNIGLNQFAEGSSHPLVTQTLMNSINIELPKDKTEQLTIASVLSSLDDKINLLHRQNKTLEAMAETLFRQWFVEEADEDNIVQISEVIDFNPFRSLSRGSVVPYLEMANVSTSVFHPYNWYDREFSSGMKFINGDTLLARITPCLENGKSAFVTFLDDGQVGWGSTEFIVMRSKRNLHPLFTYTLAKNQDFRDYAEGCLEGSSGRQRVNIDHLLKFEIGVPKEEVIHNFNSVMSAIEPKLHKNFLQIRTLEKLRDTLLPKLMSGEVRVVLEKAI
jgi:type I restriction enzyme S subunit